MSSQSADRGWNLSRWSVLHPSFIGFLMLACSAAGIAAYMRMGRAEDPSFTIKTAVVSATWPGATPEEMERYVADLVEAKLRATPNLEYLQTYCMSDAMLMLVQLKGEVRGKAADEAWYQVRKKLDDIRGDLPAGVMGPAVDDEYGDVYSAIYAFTGDEYSPAELKRLCEMTRNRLLRVEDVAKVDLIGEQEEQIFVEFSHQKLSTLGITPLQIFDSVQRQGAMVRSGSIDTDSDRIHVRVSRDFSEVENIQAIPVEAMGKVFRLGDVATVTRGYQTPAVFKTRYNGKPCVSIGVVMRNGGNIIKLGEAIEREMHVVRGLVPAGVDIGTIAFQPQVVEESVGEFLNSFIEALLIVLVVSFLSLGFRAGVVVALSVPLVLAISLVIMNMMGMNLDRITLGALILSLGLLVDDAIIAVEMMAVKMEEGWNRIDSAAFAWTSTAFPMFSGTLITIAGFLPVGIAQSTSGEYAGGIFWVVGITLIVSWFVAVVFTPVLGIALLPKEIAKTHQTTSHAPMFQTPFHRSLRWIIRACVRRPAAVVCITAAMFVAAVFGFTRLQQQFFPTSSRTEIMVDIRMHEGASIAATEAMAKRIESLLDPWLETDTEAGDVLHYATYLGSGAARFFLALNADLPNPSFAKMVIQPRDLQARERVRTLLMNAFAHEPAFADASLRVLRLEFGPPVGFPVQFRVVGPDSREVQRIAEQVREIMRQDPAAIEVNLDWDEPAKTIRVQLDQDRARLMGLNPMEIEQGLQTLLSGTPIAQYREGTESISIVARAVPQERLNLSELADMTLFTLHGRSLPLNQVGEIQHVLETPIAWRRNQERILTVRCDIADGNQAPDISARIDRQISPVRAALPPGYRIDLGGAIEESTKANLALFQVFPLMIIVMLTLLMSQVHDFRKMLLIFGIAPLGLIGAVAALHLFHAPFGFVALLGLISLAGMDMRNSVILVDQIEQDRALGLSEWDAVIESSVRRARPVLLTAATAILAMLPLTRSIFWGPMAIAIMGGLSIATFLTLINLPAIYVMIFRVRPPVEDTRSIPH
jgi:multidrug efflux pump